MGIDDLLGLAFLFFFVILPAIQGFLKRNPQAPPDEPDEIPLPPRREAPGEPQSSVPSSPAPTAPPAPRPAAPARNAAPLPPRPQPKPQPQSKPAPPKGGKTLEQLERERLARKAAPPTSPKPQPARSETPASAYSPKTPESSSEQWDFSSDRRAILNGMVWHQILAEPRSQYWRKLRKPKR